MRVARPGALLLAAVIAAPALWQGFVAHGTDEGTALVRYLIAVPVAAIMLAVFDWLAAAYRPIEDETEPPTMTVSAERRRAEEPGASGGASTPADREPAQGELPAAQHPAAKPGG